jgi:hypothetical protein
MATLNPTRAQEKYREDFSSAYQEHMLQQRDKMRSGLDYKMARQQHGDNADAMLNLQKQQAQTNAMQRWGDTRLDPYKREMARLQANPQEKDWREASFNQDSLLDDAKKRNLERERRDKDIEDAYRGSDRGRVEYNDPGTSDRPAVEGGGRAIKLPYTKTQPTTSQPATQPTTQPISTQPTGGRRTTTRRTPTRLSY